MLIALAVVAIAPMARTLAQPIANVDTAVPIDPKPDARLDGVVRVIQADLGLTGALGVDRYGAITIWITSGAKAWSGMLEVNYADPSGTKVNNYVSAATTPGRVTPVEMVVRLPAGVDTVRISDASSGRTKATLAQIPGRGELPLNVEVSGSALVATLDDVSLHRQVGDRIGMTLEQERPAKAADQEIDFWPNVRVAPITRVPQAWIAYDQCDVVVTTSTALESLGERGRAPLLDWVRSGGHMVVVSNSAAREWALAGCGDAIELDAAASLDAPTGLREAIVAGRTVEPLTNFEIRTRPIRVLDSAWKALWPIEDAQNPGRSLGAFGPVGLGTVTVFGGDPGRWTPLSSADNSIAIWRAIVKPSVEPAADVGVNAWMSGAKARSEASSRRWLLERAFETPLPNPTVLSVLLLVLVLGLAAALGPVDMVLLRRLSLRHRSHRSALAWLAGASLLAYLAPLAIRSSNDALARGVATDIVLGADGSVVEAATGQTLIYAGAATDVRLDGIAEGAWCGTASIATDYYSRSPSRILPAFNVMQSSTAQGVRQGVNPGMDIGQWTFRIMEDVQVARDRSATLRGARVERVGEEWRVSIDGLFPGETIAIDQCMLQTMGRSYGVRLEQDAGRWSGYANTAFAPIGSDYNDYASYQRRSPQTSMYRLELPMASRRTRAFDAYADAPGWSVVTLVLSRDASDVRVITGEFAAKTLNVIRIAVPTPEATRIGLADEATTTAPASSPPSPWSVHGSSNENAFKHSALDPNSLNQNTPTATTSGDNAAEDGE